MFALFFLNKSNFDFIIFLGVLKLSPKIRTLVNNNKVKLKHKLETSITIMVLRITETCVNQNNFSIFK